MPAWMGGEFDGEGIRVYVWLSPFAVHLVQHCLLIGYTPIKIKSLKGEKKKMIEKLKAQSLSNTFHKSNSGMEHRRG